MRGAVASLSDGADDMQTETLISCLIELRDELMDDGKEFSASVAQQAIEYIERHEELARESER